MKTCYLLKDRLKSIARVVLLAKSQIRGSWAQCREDLIVDTLFQEKYGIRKIKYMEIGANAPKWLSNTYYFYRNNGRGVLVEPNPTLCRKLKKYRKRDIVLNVGIANSDGYLSYFEMDTSTLNSFSEEYAKQLEEQGYKIIDKKEIRVIPIGNIFKKYGKFDYISIDTEGIDFEILKMIDYQKYAPYVICIETQEFQVERKRDDFQEINEFMKSKGYYIYMDTGINTIYAKR